MTEPAISKRFYHSKEIPVHQAEWDDVIALAYELRDCIGNEPKREGVTPSMIASVARRVREAYRAIDCLEDAISDCYSMDMDEDDSARIRGGSSRPIQSPDQQSGTHAWGGTSSLASTSHYPSTGRFVHQYGRLASKFPVSSPRLGSLDIASAVPTTGWEQWPKKHLFLGSLQADQRPSNSESVRYQRYDCAAGSTSEVAQGKLAHGSTADEGLTPPGDESSRSLTQAHSRYHDEGRFGATTSPGLQGQAGDSASALEALSKPTRVAGTAKPSIRTRGH